MRIIPNIGEEVPGEVFEDVRSEFEAYQYRLYKESVEEEKLENITQENLLEAVEIATKHQEASAEFVREKTNQLGIATGALSASVVDDKAPVGVSIPGFIVGLLYSYRKLMSKEVEIRKSVIDKGTFREVTGDKWVDNWRYQWNLRFYFTKFIFQLMGICAIYGLSPRMIHITMERALIKRSGKGFPEAFNEFRRRFGTDSELERLEKEREFHSFND